MQLMLGICAFMRGRKDPTLTEPKCYNQILRNTIYLSIGAFNLLKGSRVLTSSDKYNLKS